jgi:hypothetical protein
VSQGKKQRAEDEDDTRKRAQERQTTRVLHRTGNFMNSSSGGAFNRFVAAPALRG